MKAIQRPLHASSLCRLSSLCLRRSFPRSTIRVVFSRSFTAQRSLKANSTSSTSRKHVTVVNDDGRVRWGELSAREKAARTTQQGINLVVVIAGVALTVCFHRTPPYTRLGTRFSLLEYRVQLPHFCTQRYFHMTAKRAISTVPRTE